MNKILPIIMLMLVSGIGLSSCGNKGENPGGGGDNPPSINPPVEDNSLTVSLKTPEGFNVSSSWTGNKVKEAGDNLVLPEDSMITNTYGELSGWYLKTGNNEPVEVVKDVTRVYDDSVLMPCFKNEIIPGITSEGTSGLVYLSDGLQATQFSTTQTFFDDDFNVGKVLARIAMKSGDYFRFTSAYNVEANTNYTFTYKLTNFASETLSVRIYQVETQAVMEGALSAEGDIAPGETVSLVIKDFNVSTANANILPVFYNLNETSVDMKLGIRIYANK